MIIIGIVSGVSGLVFGLFIGYWYGWKKGFLFSESVWANVFHKPKTD